MSERPRVRSAKRVGPVTTLAVQESQPPHHAPDVRRHQQPGVVASRYDCDEEIRRLVRATDTSSFWSREPSGCRLVRVPWPTNDLLRIDLVQFDILEPQIK